MSDIPLTPAQAALAGDPRHLRLARRIARRYAARWPALADEFESAAMLGLVLAARGFDPDRRVAFATFAGYRVLGAVRDAAREALPLGYRRTPDAPAVLPVGLRGWGGTPSAGRDPDPADAACAAEDAALVRRAVGRMPPTRRRVTALWLGYGVARPLSPARIAARLGLTGNAVDSHLHYARAELAERLAWLRGDGR